MVSVYMKLLNKKNKTKKLSYNISLNILQSLSLIRNISE